MAEDLYKAAEKQHKRHVILITILIVLLVLPGLAWGVLWLTLDHYENSHELISGIHCGMSRADFEQAFAERFPGVTLSEEHPLSDQTPCVTAYCPELSVGSVIHPAIVQFGFRKSNGRLCEILVAFLCVSEPLNDTETEEETASRSFQALKPDVDAVFGALTGIYGETEDQGGMYFRNAVCGLVQISDNWFTMQNADELISEEEKGFEIPGYSFPEHAVTWFVTVHYKGAHGAHITDFPEIYSSI